MVIKPIPQDPIFKADALPLSPCDEILPIVSFATLLTPLRQGNVVDFIALHLWLLFVSFVYPWACFQVLLGGFVSY